MVFIYTPCKDTAEAKRLGHLLIDHRLAVCVNIWPIESVFLWEGKTEETKETLLLIKSLEKMVPEIEALIKKEHSYEVPFIGVFDVRRVNREYKEWMSGYLG